MKPIMLILAILTTSTATAFSGERDSNPSIKIVPVSVQLFVIYIPYPDSANDPSVSDKFANEVNRQFLVDLANDTVEPLEEEWVEFLTEHELRNQKVDSSGLYWEPVEHPTVDRSLEEAQSAFELLVEWFAEQYHLTTSQAEQLVEALLELFSEQQLLEHAFEAKDESVEMVVEMLNSMFQTQQKLTTRAD